MNQRERYIRCLTFEKVDRVPNMELGVWPETLERWRAEGMAWWVGNLFQLSDHFGMDKSFNIDWMHIDDRVCPSPAFRVVEDGGEWEILEDTIGNRLRRGKKNASIPQFLRFAVETMADYERLLPLLDPALPARYADNFDENMRGRAVREEVRGINFCGLFGYCRELMGLENFCMAIYDDIELVERLLDNRVETARVLYQRAFAKGEIDSVQMWEDMAYKTGPLVSPDFMERHMLERYREIVDIFHKGGVRLIMMDCDGNLDKIAPIVQKSGMNGVYPCEIAAGADPVRLRTLFPGVALSGGVDKRALSQDGREGVRREMKRLAPLVKDGGFIPYIDHFIPPDISYETFCYYMEAKREMLAGV